MTRLSTFYKDSSAGTGVFYPTHYLLAAFANLADAEYARAEIVRSGRIEEDVIAVSSNEAIDYAKDRLVKNGIWGVLMTELSRTIGTEAAYADQDLEAAKHGAAFLAVHCPTKRLKDTAWKLIESSRPVAARYYTSGGIEHLLGEI